METLLAPWAGEDPVRGVLVPANNVEVAMANLLTSLMGDGTGKAEGVRWPEPPNQQAPTDLSTGTSGRREHYKSRRLMLTERRRNMVKRVRSGHKKTDEKDQDEVIFVPPSDALDVDESKAADSEKGELLTDEIKLEEQEIKSASKSESKGEIQLDSEEISGQHTTESELSGQREADPDVPDKDFELEKKSQVSTSRRSTVNKLETGIAAESEQDQISNITESEDIQRLSVTQSSIVKESDQAIATESEDIPRLSVTSRSTDQEKEQAIATEPVDNPKLSVTQISTVKESDQAIATEFDDKPRLSVARSSTDKQQPVTANKFDDYPRISIKRSSNDEEPGKAIATESDDKPRLSVTRGSTDKESEQIIPFEPDEKPSVSVTRSSTDKEQPKTSVTEPDGKARLSAPRVSVVKEETARRSIIKKQDQGTAQDTRRVSVNKISSVTIQELEKETEPKRSSQSLERRRSSLRPPESKTDAPSGSKGFLSELRRSTLKVPSQVKELLSELKDKVSSRAHARVEDHEDQENGSTSDLKRFSKGSFSGKSKEVLASTSNNQDLQRKKSSVTKDQKSRKPSSSAKPSKDKAVEDSDTHTSAKKNCSDSSSGCDIMSDFSDEVADMADSILDSFVVLESEPSSSLDIAYERIFGDITKGSALKQFVVGGGTGWFAGYLTHKVGKIAVITVAGALIAVQIAQYNGLIKVNWTKVNRALTKVRARARATMLRNRQRLSERVSVDNLLHATKLFYEENFFLASGFAGGFIFGFFM